MSDIDPKKIKEIFQDLDPEHLTPKNLIDAVHQAYNLGLNFSGPIYEKALANEKKRHTEGSTYCKFRDTEEAVIRAGTALSNIATTRRSNRH